MADALSAVAANASPRAVAKASWLANPKPFAETSRTESPQKTVTSSLDMSRRFMFAGFLVCPLNEHRGNSWVMRLSQQVTCRSAPRQQIYRRDELCESLNLSR